MWYIDELHPGESDLGFSVRVIVNPQPTASAVVQYFGESARIVKVRDECTGQAVWCLQRFGCMIDPATGLLSNPVWTTIGEAFADAGDAVAGHSSRANGENFIQISHVEEYTFVGSHEGHLPADLKPSFPRDNRIVDVSIVSAGKRLTITLRFVSVSGENQQMAARTLAEYLVNCLAFHFIGKYGPLSYDGGWSENASGERRECSVAEHLNLVDTVSVAPFLRDINRFYEVVASYGNQSADDALNSFRSQFRWITQHEDPVAEYLQLYGLLLVLTPTSRNGKIMHTQKSVETFILSEEPEIATVENRGTNGDEKQTIITAIRNEIAHVVLSVPRLETRKRASQHLPQLRSLVRNCETIIYRIRSIQGIPLDVIVRRCRRPMLSNGFAGSFWTLLPNWMSEVDGAGRRSRVGPWDGEGLPQLPWRRGSRIARFGTGSENWTDPSLCRLVANVGREPDGGRGSRNSPSWSPPWNGSWNRVLGAIRNRRCDGRAKARVSWRGLCRGRGSRSVTERCGSCSRCVATVCNRIARRGKEPTP